MSGMLDMLAKQERLKSTLLIALLIEVICLILNPTALMSQIVVDMADCI